MGSSVFWGCLIIQRFLRVIQTLNGHTKPPPTPRKPICLNPGKTQPLSLSLSPRTSLCEGLGSVRCRPEAKMHNETRFLPPTRHSTWPLAESMFRSKSRCWSCRRRSRQKWNATQGPVNIINSGFLSSCVALRLCGYAAPALPPIDTEGSGPLPLARFTPSGVQDAVRTISITHFAT